MKQDYITQAERVGESQQKYDKRRTDHKTGKPMPMATYRLPCFLVKQAS